MGTLFKKIIAFNNLDDEEKELDEKTKNILTEIKDILWCNWEIDKAIGYDLEKEEDEVKY